MDARYKFKYLISDAETWAVYAQAPTITSAQAVILGMVNIEVRSLPVQLVHRAPEYKGLNFDKDFYQFAIKFKVFPMPEELKTPEFLERRRVIKLRLAYLHSLETYNQEQLNRTIDFYDKFDGYLLSAIEKCDPSTNTYHPGIVEYATISGIPVEAAYRELKMREETRGAVKLRNLAIYRKHVNIFNKLTTRDELKLAFKEAMNDLYSNI